MRVFKYRGGDDSIFIRDIESLEKDTFWAPTRDKLNDPCEGFVTEDFLINQIDSLSILLGKGNPKVNESVNMLKQSLKEIIKKKDSSGVYSLSKSCTDELLWAHYTNSHTGFCIEYDLETLLYFGRNAFLNFDVKYSDHPPTLDIYDMDRLKIQGGIDFIQKLIGVKSKRWAYEKETRVITSDAGEQDYDFRALKSIYFGLRMPDEKVQEIMKRLSGRGIEYFKIRLQNNSYRFEAEQLNDLYPTDKKYLYSIAPIAKHAVDPNSINKKWSDYAPYLQKVAEIVRREPYCNEVQMVDVSCEKSKPGKPVFFGQYQRSKYRYENMYLSPEEIDEKYSNINDLDCEINHV